MVKDPRVNNYDISCVRKALSGGAPLGGEVTSTFEALWPNRQVKLRQGWGLTE